MRFRSWTAAAALGAAVLGLAGPAAPRPAHVATIEIRSMAFGPTPADLHVGDSVEFVNQDIFQHSVTDRARGFDVDLPPHARGRILLRRAATIRFYCRYHPGMVGTLVVRP
jgi:plastocyanin